MKKFIMNNYKGFLLGIIIGIFMPTLSNVLSEYINNKIKHKVNEKVYKLNNLIQVNKDIEKLRNNFNEIEYHLLKKIENDKLTISTLYTILSHIENFQYIKNPKAAEEVYNHLLKELSSIIIKIKSDSVLNTHKYIKELNNLSHLSFYFYTTYNKDFLKETTVYQEKIRNLYSWSNKIKVKNFPILTSLINGYDTDIYFSLKILGDKKKVKSLKQEINFLMEKLNDNISKLDEAYEISYKITLYVQIPINSDNQFKKDLHH